MSSLQTPNDTAHVPVMCADVIEVLQPRDAGVYVDGTFGAGGYTRAILAAAHCRVIAIDRDPDAVREGKRLAQEYPERLCMAEGPFADMAELIKAGSVSSVDGVVLDIGVSSMQIDDAGRGFSFMNDGPLDMRMDQGRGDTTQSAADVVNTEPETKLSRIIKILGDERRSRQIARAIVEARRAAPIETTGALAAIVEKAMGPAARAQRIHPATRTFQALRMYVNDELEQLARALMAAETILNPGGRLVVVAFHSLEDRLVKRFFQARTTRPSRPSRHMPEPPDSGPEPTFEILTSGARKPGDEEVAANPRARSARLRAGERTAAPTYPATLADFGIAAL